MAEAETAQRARPRWAIIAIVVAAALVAGGVLVLVAGRSAHQRTFDADRPLGQRVAAAQQARCLAPWNDRYRAREFVMVMWLGGQGLLDAGDYQGAVMTLRSAYRRAYRAGTRDAALLALFQRAQEVQAIATNRKAHLQHGHEGPGSSLRPQDVER